MESEVIAGNRHERSTWTVARGKDGTSAVAHNTGKSVSLLSTPALYGIFTAASSTYLLPNNTTGPGQTPSTSQTWPWPKPTSAGGTEDFTGPVNGTLSYYLTHNVYLPTSAPGSSNPPRLLTTTDQAFYNIMRLYNWDYVIDNVGTPCDWRIRFFGTNDNTKIFNGSGSLNPPGSSGMWPGSTSAAAAIQTYNEILRWLNQSTDPFPTQLRAGRVKYYGSAIAPTASATVKWNPVYTGGITGSYPNWGGTDQRFWVEFINYVLGYYQTGATSYQDISAMAGYGSDFTWGTQQRNSPPSWVDPITASPTNTQNVYMNYQDNPLRPQLRHWFSPINMVEYLQNYNMLEQVNGYTMMQPGDSYEAPLYTGKEGFQAAIATMQNNHPNDWFTLAMYSWPRTSSTAGFGRFNCVSCPLGTNYAYASRRSLFPLFHDQSRRHLQ